MLKHDDRALLINLGDGSVLEHLAEIGVKQVDWVLFADHHREQCQGTSKLDRQATQVAAPKEEQAFFETPNEFRHWNPRLSDKFTVHGYSYLRPPAQPVKIDKGLVDGDTFTWNGLTLTCVSTPGHSPGGMSFVLKQAERAVVSTGGVMHDGAKMTNWFDTEWDYGFAKGLDALIATVDKLIALKPQTDFPSQGPVIANATAQPNTYKERLTRFRPDYVRGLSLIHI